jgi:serine/threonine protein kinase
MNADNQKLRDALASQLASFDSRLQSAADDVELVAEIRKGIGAVLASDAGNEREVRRVLQDRYDAGELRKETFHLVKSMLDSFGTEKERPPAAPAVPKPQDKKASTATPVRDTEDSFGATTVIPTDALPVNDTEGRVQVGSVLRDRFMLRKRVSGGSMGVVYKALDRRLAEAGSEDPHVAIKVLSPALAEDGDALRALQQEAAKTRCLVHPHIVRFIDLDRDHDLYFLVLEWLEGRTLADILDSNDSRSIDTEAAFRIAKQVGEALAYAHRCGIVHADVKPGNIMMMPNGDAKLFDFGVARVRQKQSERSFDPGVLGAVTPAYSSMQVLGGEDPVAADDVFSLACLLYRLVAGYRVFGPRNAAQASEEGMQPQRPQGVNDEQWAALKKALSYARVTRFGSITEFLDALGDIEADSSVEDTISFEAPKRFVNDNDGRSPGGWIAGVVVLLGLLVIGAQQLGYLDQWLGPFKDTSELTEVEPPETEITDFAPEPVMEFTELEPPLTEGAIVESDPVEVAEPEIEALPAETSAPDSEVPGVPLVDFSTLPPPATIINFSMDGEVGQPTRVVLREDSDPVIVDFIRAGDLSQTLTLRLEEVGFSGNFSPWATGQYALSNAGLVAFPAGQARARVTFRAASDPRREADQQSTLRLRLADLAESEFAVLNVTLEDDDRRVFESTLPINTIGFATNQVSVSESDPAVQIDVMRFNPDASSMEVAFSVEGHTATEGEDYFAPASYTVSFGPMQRSARLLIPLVQDTRSEGDEAFVVKLLLDKETQPNSVSPNLAVMIRDDEL